MNALIDVAGWTLVRFVWQGALIAAAAAGVLRLARQASATVRYAVACGALTAMLVAPAVTAWSLRAPARGTAAFGVPISPELSAQPMAFAPAVPKVDRRPAVSAPGSARGRRTLVSDHARRLARWCVRHRTPYARRLAACSAPAAHFAGGHAVVLAGDRGPARGSAGRPAAA